VFLLEQEASAFCRTTTCDPSEGDTCRKEGTCIHDGAPLKWKSLPITYRFHSAGSSKPPLDDQNATRQVIRQAFNAWTNVQCNGGKTSLRFQEGPEINQDKPLGDKDAAQPYGIYFRDESWPHNDAEESIALTNQIYGKVTGYISYADIEINTAQVTFALTDTDRTKGTDLQAVMTHEVGHYIGLAHSDDKDSIMVARYCQADNDRCKGGIDLARGLAQDDQDAVCLLYDPGDSSPPASQGCDQAGTPSPGDVATIFGLLFVGSAFTRRRFRTR